jgi:hypothetical protein
MEAGLIGGLIGAGILCFGFSVVFCKDTLKGYKKRRQEKAAKTILLQNPSTPLLVQRKSSVRNLLNTIPYHIHARDGIELHGLAKAQQLPPSSEPQ